MASQGISSKYVEGLRLSERERALLIEQMKKSGLADRRKSPRIIIEGNFSVLLTMDSPGGSTAYFRIYPWDLSRGGVGFFHRSFVYPGTRCSYTGLTFDGEPFTIKGEVVRCAHVSGQVHAVGTKLDAEIDPEKYLGSGAGVGDAPPVADWWSQAVTRAAAVSKLSREHATAEAIRAAAALLMDHLGTEPTTVSAAPANRGEPGASAPNSPVPAACSPHEAPAAKAA